MFAIIAVLAARRHCAEASSHHISLMRSQICCFRQNSLSSGWPAPPESAWRAPPDRAVINSGRFGERDTHFAPKR